MIFKFPIKSIGAIPRSTYGPTGKADTRWISPTLDPDSKLNGFFTTAALDTPGPPFDLQRRQANERPLKEWSKISELITLLVSPERVRKIKRREVILGGVDSVLTPAKEGAAPPNVNCLEMVLHHHQKRSGLITVSSFIEYFRQNHRSRHVHSVSSCA